MDGGRSSRTHHMGSIAGPGSPPHEVVIGNPLAVGMFEVAVEEFSRFVAETNYETGGECWTHQVSFSLDDHSWSSPDFAQAGRHPVVCVNWDEATAYVGWLSTKVGARYRLLSESEWEYAARAGTTTARYWGDDESGQCRHANGSDRSIQHRVRHWRGVRCNDGAVRTVAVGSYTQNDFGLYDVLGNASEWVDDCWHENYDDAPADGAAWIDGGDCEQRMIRGGSWYDSPWTLRSASRRHDGGTSRANNRGFRVARELSP